MHEVLSQTLQKHLRVGPDKPVSYLPIRTLETSLGLPVPVYVALIEKSGNTAIVFHPNECCINSGAVYAYSKSDLEHILEIHRVILAEAEWPNEAAVFIQRIAANWLPDDHILMPVIRQAFGE
jgi:hypothetical protein